jgi:copper(I)-binding protein
MRTSRSITAVALLTIAALLIAACASSAAGIVVKEPFSRASPTGATTGGAFMTIVNNGRDADRLISASSPAAKTVELHETVDENGVMKMEPRPEGFEIPAGGTLELKPGGKHIMLIDLVAPLEAGKTIEITLNFEKAGPQKIQAPVQKM